MKNIVYILITVLGIGAQAAAQDCPNLTTPLDGQTGVEVDSPIIWEEVNDPNFVGFLISLGTTPGGEDILKSRSAGVDNEFISPTGLPEDTVIYVTIRMFIQGQGLKVCASQSFSTADVTIPPLCTSLNTEITAPPSIRGTFVSWYYAPTATGYYLTVGSSENGNDIVDRIDVGNNLDYEILPPLSEDLEVYVTITPYNENGAATNCDSENFLALETTANLCSSYYDSSQGGVIYPSPQLTFPDFVFICQSSNDQVFKLQDKADGARWFRVDTNGNEELISNTLETELTETGTYVLEAYNDLPGSTSTIECTTVKEFQVFLSDAPNILSVEVTGEPNNRTAVINVSGSGDYEYALNDAGSTYRSFNTFDGLGPGEQQVFVRDKNGCGTVVAIVPRVLGTEDFPNFFTPNNDSSNDRWKFDPIDRKMVELVNSIHIYDRYGRLMAEVEPGSKGWDGTHNGRPLPPSDYWYIATTTYGDLIKGHFTLKQ